VLNKEIIVCKKANITSHWSQRGKRLKVFKKYLIKYIKKKKIKTLAISIRYDCNNGCSLRIESCKYHILLKAEASRNKAK
jgi:hypothetical protein